MKSLAALYALSCGPRMTPARARVTSIRLFAPLFVFGVIGIATAAMAQPPVKDQATQTPQIPAAVPASPLTEHLDRTSPIRMVETSSIDASGFAYATVVPSAVTGVITLAALLLTYRGTKKTIEAATRNNAAAIWHKANETELKDIQDQIGEFYEVFLQISEMSRLLSRELKSRQEDPGRFALLRALLDPAWRANLSTGDRTVVEEICSNGERLSNLTLSRKVPIEPQLRPYFARAAAHFRMLKLAFAGGLGDDMGQLRRYIYPYQLNNVITLELQRLRARQAVLRETPASQPPPLPPLVIPEDHDHQLPAWPDTPREPLPPPT